MKPDLYNETSSRAHIKRTVELLTKPTLLTSQQNISKEEEQLVQIEKDGQKQGLSMEDVAKKQEEYVREVQKE